LWKGESLIRVSLAAFQHLHELILIEEKVLKILTHHWWAEVVSGMGRLEAAEKLRKADSSPAEADSE